MTVSNGLSFGAAIGWSVDIIAVVTDIYATKKPAKTAVSVGAAASAFALVAALGLPAISSAVASPEPTAPQTATGFRRTQGNIIVDGNGNQVLLRGVNVIQLVDFCRPEPSMPTVRPLTEQDYSDVASYGFNVVRLNLSWAALEPERSQLDTTYLARYRTMWGYDWAPEWATITDCSPRCQFTGRDISPADNRAFQHFFFDTDGVRTALAQTWGKLAELCKDEPMVAGSDLLNEPDFGETAPATTAIKLGDFYNDAIKEIRAAGAQRMIYLEPGISWSGLGFDTGPIPGFTNDTNIVFSPHLYAESITMDSALRASAHRQSGTGVHAGPADIARDFLCSNGRTLRADRIVQCDGDSTPEAGKLGNLAFPGTKLKGRHACG